MSKTLLSAFLLATSAFGQYKLESAGPPPSELAPAIRDALQSEGAKIMANGGSVYAEVWLRKTAPSGPASTEQGVTLATVPHGSLLGAIRVGEGGQDRRGQPIKAGVYTLRYSLFPPDGNHQGVALQRDFLHLLSAAGDKDLNSTPSFAELMKTAKKTAGGGHPFILSLWKDEAGHPVELVQEGEDWVLYTKIGDLPVGIILVGIFVG